MKTFKFRGKTYKWNFKRSPMYIFCMTLFAMFMIGTTYFVAIVMCGL